MRHGYHVRQGADDRWIVLNPNGAPLVAFRRRRVADAYGKALAHRAKVSLVVHRCSVRTLRYSDRELTYSVRL